MIGHLPTSYQDELFYSICVRFSNRMRYPTTGGVMRALFGRRHAIAVVDLPNHLERIVSALPPGNAYTVDGIISDHTLFPYYAPFIDSNARESIRGFMRTSDDASVRTRCGICTNRVKPPRYFRFCPICNTENLEKYDETYWHRHFQLTGVEICPRHEIILNTSDIRFHPQTTRHRFFSAETAGLITATKPIDRHNLTDNIFLQLAKDIEWILSHPDLGSDLESIRNRYVELLQQRSLATKSGYVRLRELISQFREHFSAEILNVFQSPVHEDKSNVWLARMLRPSRNMMAPLRHLLLMNFLQVSPEHFFYHDRARSLGTARREKKGPWLCLNPVCPHFKQPAITKYELQYDRKRRIDIGIFTCPECAYTYGLHHWEKPAVKPDFVRTRGKKWELRLKKLWLDERLTLRQIAATLGVDPKTVKQHAHFQELSFPRPGVRPTKREGIYTPRARKKTYTVKFQRAAWLNLRKAYPDKGTKQLRTIDRGIYSWLYQHDRSWLKNHLPPHAQTFSPRSMVDWAVRDEKLVIQVEEIARQLSICPGKLCRITRNVIGREMGDCAILSNALHKMPLTKTMIEIVTETSETFALRRIHRAVQQFNGTNGKFARWELIRAAGLRKMIELLPVVQAALDDALAGGAS